MNSALASFIRDMPKVELHVHLEGAVKAETLLALAERNQIALPFNTADDIRRSYRFRSFQDFAKALLMVIGCVRKPEDLSFLVRRLGEDLHRQNIRYAEVTWTPQLHAHLGCPAAETLAALNEGRHEVEKRHNLTIRWIPDLVRSYPGPALKVQAWAASAEARARGVVALGLGGPETETIPPQIQEAFRRARAAGLPANPHAGEAAGPKSVWLALRNLNAVRIGHGVRAIEDEQLIDYLVEKHVVLEVCPTSNVALGHYPGYDRHPLRRLIEAGCQVTINSDDPALFGSDLTSEYGRAIDDCAVTLEQLETCVMTAVRASYLADSEKAAMAGAFEAEITRLRVKHGLSAGGSASSNGK